MARDPHTALLLVCRTDTLLIALLKSKGAANPSILSMSLENNDLPVGYKPNINADLCQKGTQGAWLPCATDVRSY